MRTRDIRVVHAMMAMCLTAKVLVASVTMGLVLISPNGHSALADDWAEFRGPARRGSVGSADVPLTWDATNNVRWRADLPGRGASSPVVWHGRVFVTCYSGFGVEDEAAVRPTSSRELGQSVSASDPNDLVRHVLCYDAASGRELWSVPVPSTGRIGRYRGNMMSYGYATATPVVDEQGVYVAFGTTGVIAFDHRGRERWRTPIGQQPGGAGCCASPILSGELLIVNADQQSGAMLAIDRSSGERVWETKISPKNREDTCSTPLLIRTHSRDELICHLDCERGSDQGIGLIGALDPASGKKLWSCQVRSGFPGNLSPSPIMVNGAVLLMGKFNSTLVRPGGSGDVTETHVVWTSRDGDNVTTPLYHDGHIFRTSFTGFAECVDAATGKRLYRARFNPSCRMAYASGVIVGKRIYYVSRLDGVYVVAANPKFEQLAHNVIEDDDTAFNGTPAISGDMMYLRSDKRLYCISE